MIYKLKNGGIVKLQAAGRIPKLKRLFKVISKKGSEAVKTLTNNTSKVPTTIETIPDSHRIFRAPVYKGGSIRDPYFSFFTTDPEYARQYGPVNKYILEQKGPAAIAKEPMIGSSDIVENDMFIDRNTRGVPGAKIILGHDLITSDIPIKSKGLEILSINMPSSLTLVSNPKAATTYHFDGRMPMSRPISAAEKLGIPKGERNQSLKNNEPFRIELIKSYNEWIKRFNDAANKDAESLKQLELSSGFKFDTVPGYEPLSQNATIQEAMDQIKQTMHRHNRYYRGVFLPVGFDAELVKSLPEEEQLITAATRTRASGQGLWITPETNAGIYGSNGKVALIERPFKFGKDPRKWISDGDFKIGYSSDAFGKGYDVIMPWNDKPQFNSNEYLSFKPMRFIQWQPTIKQTANIDGKNIEYETVDLPRSNTTLNFKQGGKITKFKNKLKK